MLLQVVSAKGTAIGATIAALAAVTGDTLVVPSFNDPKKAWLLQAWANVQVAGTLRIKSPKMHDNVNGLRVGTIINDTAPIMPWRAPQRLYPNDTISVELAGSAVAGDVEHVVQLQAFEEVPGQAGQLLSIDEVMRRIKFTITVENTIATDTSGNYSGAAAINATIDQFQTDYDYAILGYKTDTVCSCVGYRAPAWANARVGGPGFKAEPAITADWFLRLSRVYGLPLVPVFRGNDKASVLVDALIDENGADPKVTTYLAALSRS